MTIAEWLRSATEELKQSGCPDPAVDARWIAEDALRMSPTELRFEGHNALRPKQLDAMNAFLSRRKQGEPVQYILQRADIMRLPP